MSRSTTRSSRLRQNRNAHAVVASILSAVTAVRSTYDDSSARALREQITVALEGYRFNAAVTSRVAGMQGVRLELEHLREQGINWSLAAELLNKALFPKRYPSNVIREGC